MSYIPEGTTNLTTGSILKSQSGYILLATKAATSGAAITFTSLISATYNNYFLLIENLQVTSATPLLLNVSANNGSSYITTNYQSGTVRFLNTGAALTNSNSTAAILFSPSNIQTTGTNCQECYFCVNGPFNYISNFGKTTTVSFAGGYAWGTNTSTAVNAFEINIATGAFQAGQISLYGILE